MVSAGVSLAASAGAFAGIPVVGWAAAIGGALIDAYVIQPELQGKRRSASRSPRLLGSPVGSNEPGSPRIYALGNRLRVPTHILWQDSKTRETTSGGNKAGTSVAQRRTFVDALIALNDRKTKRLTQLIGNGTTLISREQNLVRVRSSAIVASVSGGRLILTAGSTLDPDFADSLVVNDAVRLSGFVGSAGVDVNAGYWKIDAVVSHTSTPSRIELSPYSGQSVAGIVTASGNAFAPATVTRVDDVIFVEGSGTSVLSPIGKFWRFDGSTNRLPGDLFSVGEELTFEGFTNGFGVAVNGDLWSASVRIGSLTSTQLVCTYQPSTIGSGGVAGGGANNPGRIRSRNPSITAEGYFPTTFNPDTYYHDGSDTQAADALISASKGSGNVPAYRGVACQGLDDFFVTQFGDQLPFSLEAVIDPDDVLDWATAMATILSDRTPIPNTAIDVTGIDSVPFLGAYLRGPVEAASAIQPLLMAKQIVGQERDGNIALFQIDRADVVRIENGPVFSHMASRPDGESPEDDKMQVDDTAEEDLPTSVGVRHQDPDNRYADGYQQFGLRNPLGIRHENRQEIDLSNVVLTRKEARNLAATVLRRAWINRRTFRMTLTPHYLHLLENDIVTWTDDDGFDFTARVIQRDIGSDFRVSITAVEEDLDLAVAGSPVQSASGDAPVALRSSSASLRTVIFDAPGIDDSQVYVPAIGIAVCAELGSAWGGAQVWESQDKGVSWSIVGTISDQASIGTTTADIAAETSAESVGAAAVQSVQSLPVDFDAIGGSDLSTSDVESVASGLNWMLVVDPDGNQEIMAHEVAVPDGGESWTLSGIYRGLRGTLAQARAAGSTVVRLSPAGNAGIFWRQFQGAITARALLYRVVPLGGSFDGAPILGITAQWRNAQPLPVRSVSRTIEPGNTARISVVHNWTRSALPIGAQPPHPVDEQVEAYAIDIYDPTGTSVRRSISLSSAGTGSPTLRDRWVDYTSVEQTEDGYTPGPSVSLKVRVRQVGQFGTGPGEILTVGP